MRAFLMASAIALLLTSQASAHVVLADPHADADTYYAGQFRVGHGCGDSPTVSIRIEIPADVTTARPQPKAGWEISVEREALATPVQVHGQPQNDRVSAITWRGRLAADQFDDFGLMIRTPNHAGDLVFRAVQTCETGSAEWTPSLMLHTPDAPASEHNH
jgi:uncharacterized protein YcnI